MNPDPAFIAGSTVRGGESLRFSRLRAKRLPLLALVGLAAGWSAFTSCAPLRLGHGYQAIEPRIPAPADRRIRATGSAVARDLSLARDLADARACRNLSEPLETRLRVGMGRYDSARGKQGDSATGALARSAGNSLGIQNLVGCRILYRSDLDSAGRPFVISTAELDSAEAVDVLRSTLLALRGGARDTALVDSLIGRVPAMLR